MRAGKFFLQSVSLLCFVFVANIKTYAQLKANFVSNIQSGCPPLVVSFQDLSTGNPASWKWDLGNGVITTLQNPITTYFDPGTYTVKLVVKNGSGVDSIIKTSYITVYADPQASFNVTPTTGCFPLNVCFYDKSYTGTGPISDYLWDFGDGNISTEAQPCHTYINGGTFDITLKVTNINGCSNTVTKSDLIKIDNGVIADFSITSVDVCKTPALVTFKNSSTGSGTLNYFWNFGDGKTSTLPSPSHTYSASGTYNVMLTVSSSAGCTDTASAQVIIAFPSSSFTGAESACANKTLDLKNTSSPKPVSCTWDFGDGTTSAQLNPSKVFTTPGTYTIKLVNTFSATCSDSISKNVTVYPGPSASFTTNDTANCTAPYDVQFTNTSSGSATSYKWNFGDGTTSTEKDPLHVYRRSGSFTVTLTAINANGCEDDFTIPDCVVIKEVKITDLGNLPDSGCIPVTVYPVANFNIAAKIKKYTWSFGDGSFSNEAHPKHVYYKEGFYNITLTIETYDGCSDTYTKYNAVLAGHKPTVSFTADPPDICASETTTLINTSTNGPIHFLSWNYEPLTDAHADSIHPYEPTDTGYIPLILVAYNYGCPDTLEQDSLLYVRPPVAKMRDSLNCTDKYTVNFGDSSVADITRTWYFGDGLTDTTENPAHTYAASGFYTVRLIAVNGNCADTIERQIHVIDEKGKIKAPGTAFCRGALTDFDIAGVNHDNIVNTIWDFGDGQTATVGGTAASHTYNANGVYMVSATMTDINGCPYYYQMPDSVHVYGPDARFNALGACLGSPVTFNDVSENDGVHPIVKWTWDYGDKIIQDFTAPPFLHTYSDTGYYSVKLTTTDNFGCTDSVKRGNYLLISKPYAGFVLSDSVICPGAEITLLDTSVGRNLQYVWDFGEGSQSTEQSPSFQYMKTGVYHPELHITDVNGCMDSTSRKLVVGNPDAKFSMSDSSSTCPPLQVNFANKSVNYKSFVWDFGDGSTSTLLSPSHLYTYPGIYPVSLILTGVGGCTDTLVKNVTIAGPTGVMRYDSLPYCFPSETQFLADTKGAVVFTWDFGDGNTITTTKSAISHGYDTGWFLPRMIIADSLGCNVLIKGKDTIRVSAITANAMADGNPACDSSLVTFTDLSYSQEEIIHHYWDFGDGNTTDQQTVSHSYIKPGMYDAKLISVNKIGCRDTFDIPQPIVVSPTPVINITGDSIACANTSLSLSAINNAADTSALIWSWNFSNGVSDNAANVNIVFPAGGIYTATLIGATSTGCKDTAYKNLKVNDPPVVKTSADTAICQNTTYLLSATGAATYLWAGENMSCTDCASTMISPSRNSMYTVTGWDAIGCSATDTVNVRIVIPADIKVESTGDTLCMGQTSKLSASGAYTYQWYPSNFLDSTNVASPTFTAAKDTTMTYHVIGHGENDCYIDTADVRVKVYPVPQMRINDNEILLNVGTSVKLQTTNSPDITNWTWQPAEGLDNPYASSPMASPKESIKYTCVATNGGSCVSRDEIVVTVICKNTNVFIPNTFSPNKDGVNDIFYPRGVGLFTVKSFRVFNRWGQLIFDRYNVSPNSSSDGWDGTYNGKLQTPDVYVYVMEVQCENGVIIPIKGNITLLR